MTEVQAHAQCMNQIFHKLLLVLAGALALVFMARLIEPLLPSLIVILMIGGLIMRLLRNLSGKAFSAMYETARRSAVATATARSKDSTSKERP